MKFLRLSYLLSENELLFLFEVIIVIYFDRQYCLNFQAYTHSESERLNSDS